MLCDGIIRISLWIAKAIVVVDAGLRFVKEAGDLLIVHPCSLSLTLSGAWLPASDHRS
jgi:hypothetical protein